MITLRQRNRRRLPRPFRPPPQGSTLLSSNLTPRMITLRQRNQRRLPRPFRLPPQGSTLLSSNLIPWMMTLRQRNQRRLRRPLPSPTPRVATPTERFDPTHDNATTARIEDTNLYLNLPTIDGKGRGRSQSSRGCGNTHHLAAKMRDSPIKWDPRRLTGRGGLPPRRTLHQPQPPPRTPKAKYNSGGGSTAAWLPSVSLSAARYPAARGLTLRKPQSPTDPAYSPPISGTKRHASRGH